MVIYPTIYEDKKGKESTIFQSDGFCLFINLRGYEFYGGNFDNLTLVEENKIEFSGFSFNQFNALTNCTFKIQIPIKLTENKQLKEGQLNMSILICNNQFPQINQFALNIDNIIFSLIKNTPTLFWMDTQLPQLQKLLPSNIKMQTCLYCAFSNYSVSGSDSFGSLICYKDIKEEILNIQSKSSYMDIFANNGNSTQETFWCDEFEEIKPNQWQYKDSI